MRYIKIDNSVTCDKICRLAQEVMQEMLKDNENNPIESFLTITISPISHTIETNNIKNLENKK